MLWKYKKCYTEVSKEEDIPTLTCYKIDSVYYIKNEGVGETLGINFVTCIDEIFETYDVSDNETLDFIDKCIKSNSIVLTVGGIPGFLVTDLEISNAIAYNSGFLVKNFLGGEYVVLSFSLCT